MTRKKIAASSRPPRIEPGTVHCETKNATAYCENKATQPQHLKIFYTSDPKIAAANTFCPNRLLTAYRYAVILKENFVGEYYMRRTRLFQALLLLALPAICSADTFTATCDGVVYAGGDCSAFGNAMASAGYGGAITYTLGPLATASASATGSLSFVVTGDTGSGSFVPIFGTIAGNGSSTFGTESSGVGGPVGSPIDFVFGQYQSVAFSYTASTFGLYGYSQASAPVGFTVYDSLGNLVTDGVVSLTTATPEPAALPLCVAGLGGMALYRRRTLLSRH